MLTRRWQRVEELVRDEETNVPVPAVATRRGSADARARFAKLVLSLNPPVTNVLSDDSGSSLLSSVTCEELAPPPFSSPTTPVIRGCMRSPLTSSRRQSVSFCNMLSVTELPASPQFIEDDGSERRRNVRDLAGLISARENPSTGVVTKMRDPYEEAEQALRDESQAQQDKSQKPDAETKTPAPSRRAKLSPPRLRCDTEDSAAVSAQAGPSVAIIKVKSPGVTPGLDPTPALVKTSQGSGSLPAPRRGVPIAARAPSASTSASPRRSSPRRAARTTSPAARQAPRTTSPAARQAPRTTSPAARQAPAPIVRQASHSRPLNCKPPPATLTALRKPEHFSRQGSGNSSVGRRTHSPAAASRPLRTRSPGAARTTNPQTARRGYRSEVRMEGR